MTDARTKLYGLMGDPVEHSFSPLIQNTFFETEGINGNYGTFRVEKGETGDALKGAKALGIGGFNVTVPHKEDVMSFLSGIDPAAKKIGAVNTLRLTEEGYYGYNTDYSGIKREIEEHFDIRGEKAVMIGAGGAANAILAALYDLGAESVYILNRSPEKAERKFGSDKRNVILPLDGYEKIPGKGYFCVQCTSVGLHPDEDKAPIEDDAFYEKIDRAVDVIYNPAETLFMRKVREAGGKAENGLPMLLYQAAESFYHFTGVRVRDEAVKLAGERLRTML